jgi:Mn-dependent DtxR family transcriptional regulator
MTLEHINESAENYLETILVLSERLAAVRSIDIVHELGFKKSSVSVAMKNLRESNHIVMDENGFIHLTETGLAIASMVLERHQLLATWLKNLGVPEQIASEDACKLEHVLSKESFAAIKNHVEYFKNMK